MGGIVAVSYGAAVYLVFLAAFLYAVAFVGNLPVPKTVDSGASGSLGAALLIDIEAIDFSQLVAQGPAEVHPPQVLDDQPGQAFGAGRGRAGPLGDGGGAHLDTIITSAPHRRKQAARAKVPIEPLAGTDGTLAGG